MKLLMRFQFYLALVFFITGTNHISSQVKIAELTFETAGGYTTGIPEHTNGNSIYFIRTDGSNISPFIAYTNTQGNFFFGAQNVDGEPDGTYTIPEYFNIDNININGYTSLEFRVHLAESSYGGGEHWDNSALFVANDYVRFNYDIDNSGTFSNLLWIEGTPATFGDREPRIDTDFNGVGDGTEITNTFTQFIEVIPGTGALLDIQIQFRLDKQYEDIAIDNIEIWGIAPTTCALTTTWNGTTWDNGDPDNSKQAILNADYSTTTDLPGSFEACSLLINPGIVTDNNILAIQGSDYITIINDIVLENYTKVEIATEASLLQVNDAANVTLNGTGIGELQKTTTFIDDWFDYTYWSSPFTNETIGSALAGVPNNRVFKYDASNYIDADNNGFDDNANDWIIAPQAEVMTPGKGYAAVADAFAPMPGTQTYTFDGQFNNGIITPVVTVSPGPNPINWNFLGNPYPSPINADLFLGHASNTPILNGTMYFWTHNSDPSILNLGNEAQNFSIDDYASYNLTGGVGTAALSGNVLNNNTIPNGIIATGQGFFIEAIAGGVATFNNSMRVNTGNDNFYRTTDRIWLDFKNVHGAFSQILIGFNENATNGVDRLYDGIRLDVGAYVSFYSLIENVEDKYAIQSRESLTEEEMIPLGIMSTLEGENEFTVAISQVEGLLETSEVYLLDSLLNIEHNLSETDYTFTTDNGEFKDRFVLTLKTDLNQIDYSVEDELIVVKNENGHIDFTTRHQTEIQNIQVFDVLGRQLYTINFNNETTIASLKLNVLNNSIFIVKATLIDGIVLSKKALITE